MKKSTLYLLTLILFGCQSTPASVAQEILPGARQMEEYLPLLQNKNIGLVVNPTSIVGKKHLLDTLIALDQTVVKILAPEHGLRGNKSAGEIIKDGVDQTTGLLVVSL
jgi:uncharacterized protein YbbC (DUF1343 family)